VPARVPTEKNVLAKEIDGAKSFIDRVPNEIDLVPSFIDV
jgi:hypothetical protein